jgi:hypothetical protein
LDFTVKKNRGGLAATALKRRLQNNGFIAERLAINRAFYYLTLLIEADIILT